MAFFVFVKMGKAPLSRALREIKQLLRVQSLILCYIKQIDSMLPCICPVIDHRGRQNVVRTSVTHSAIASCATFFVLTTFWRHLWSITGQMHGNMESICKVVYTNVKLFTFVHIPKVGDAVAYWLVRLSPDQAVRVRVQVRVRALTGDIVLCSWARHFTLTVPLSTQVYKWVPANLMLGVTLRWTGIPSRGE